MMLAVTASALSQSARQTAQTQNLRGGTLTGHITIEGKPAAGVRVLLIPDESDNLTSRRHALDILALTDEDGKFRLTGVPAGTFILTVADAAYVLPETGSSATQGKTVIVHEGEEVSDLDLSLKRGGIITGRVADANGQPVIGERVSLQLVDKMNRNRRAILHNQSGETDDRGIYRVYGLPAGRYLVSIGRLPRPSSIKGGPGGNAPITYYPGVIDETKATAIEVHVGGEVENINITLGRSADTFNVTGRVIDAETGFPLPHLNCGYKDVTGNRLPITISECKTNANGEFRLEHVQPGRYAAFILSDSKSDFYSEPTPFEVSSGDVQGLEIKVRRGSSISGEASVEGVKDPAILSKLSQLTVYVQQPNKLSTSPAAQAAIAPDGSFHLSGVPPGKVSFLVLSYPRQDFSLLRVEHNGVEQSRGVDVPAGESVSGVRLILTYGKGSIRGQIKTENGTLPAGSSSRIGIAPISSPTRITRFVEPDSQGRFFITGIPAGEYELTVRITTPAIPGIRSRLLPPTKQLVTVKNGVDTEVSVVLDLARMK